MGFLFSKRHKQRVRLSEPGRHLYVRVSTGLDDIRVGMQQVAAWNAGMPVTIGCTHAVSHLLIMPVFEDLQTAMGRLGQVRVMTADYTILDAHLDPQIDIRFAYDVSDIPQTEYVLLLPEAVKPVCSPEFKRRHDAELRKQPRAWSAMPLLEMASPNRGWASWDDWFRSHAVSSPEPARVQFDSYVYLLEACAAGRGLALSARGMADSYLSNGRLVEAYDDYMTYDRGFYAVLTQRGRGRAAARRCLKALQEFISPQYMDR